MKEIMYRTAAKEWSMNEGGNHRILVRTPKGSYVHAALPWRRCDEGARSSGIQIRYTSEGAENAGGIGSCEVKNIRILNTDRFEGEIVFEAHAEGIYEVYFQGLQGVLPHSCL